MSAPRRNAGGRRRVTSSTSLLDVDELLFEPTGWFAIDAGNQRVPRVRVPSLQDGLALIGQGQVATIVGRLRPGVRVVDVDLAGEAGHAVAELLARWAHDRGVWCLVRPSGGADGRCHVFLATGPAPTGQGVGSVECDDLGEYVTQLRASFKTSAASIDLRRSGHVRPLSAPHRHGGCPRPGGDLRTVLRGLRSALQASDQPRSRTRPRASTSSTAAGGRGGGGAGSGGGAGGVEALVPRPRPRRPLPAAWERYLATGQAPEVGGEDRSRSTVEAIVTAHLVRAGHDATTAWAAITTAHPAAMTRARASRRRWTAWVWNRAVAEDHDRDQRPAHGYVHGRARSGSDASPDPSSVGAQPSAGQVGGQVGGQAAREVAAAVAAARAHLVDDVMWRVPVRQRRAVALVAHHVLDRIERTAAIPAAAATTAGEGLRVPVPERDLVLDTGLRDRKTIRAALRLLDGHLGRLHRDAWDPARRETTSYEFEISSLPPISHELTDTQEGVSQIPPPSSHTPHPAPAPGTWSRLPGATHALWRALLAAPAGLSPAEAALTAALVETPTQTPSTAQLRSTTAALDQLAREGLVVCDVDGVWTVSGAPGQDLTSRSASSRAYRELEELVSGERQAYRTATGSRSTAWSLARARAIKADHARARAWWTGLNPAERRARRGSWTSEFHELPIVEQERVKTRLADSRIRAGVDEAARHAAWLDQLTPDEFVHRSITRQAVFDAWPGPLQQDAAAAWERHRHRYGISRTTTRLSAARPDRLHIALTPSGVADRNHQQLELELSDPSTRRSVATRREAG